MTELTAFHADVIREMRRQGATIKPRYVRKAWISFCLRHRQKRLKFRGDGKAGPAGPTSFTVIVCEECRIATLRKEDFVNYTRWLGLVPRSVPLLDLPQTEDL